MIYYPTPLDFYIGNCPAPIAGCPHFATATGDGSVLHVEGLLLYGLAAKLGGPILELGAERGVSTRYMMAANPWPGALTVPPELKVVSVDTNHLWPEDATWPSRERVTHDSGTFRRAGFEPAMTFIDGDHRYDGVVADIKTALAHGCERLVFHDTSPDCKPATASNVGSDARRAVLDQLKDWELHDINSPCGMIYARKV